MTESSKSKNPVLFLGLIFTGLVVAFMGFFQSSLLNTIIADSLGVCLIIVGSVLGIRMKKEFDKECLT